jgi:hypothetical protein
MSIWSNLKAKLRRIARAMVLSEEHLGAMARSGEQLVRLNQTAQTALSTDAQVKMATNLERAQKHLGFIAAMAARREMVEVMADPRFDDPLRLERSGFRVHSQYDEDGIIAEIFRRIGTESRTFVEFGSGNGDENCTAFLLLQGWRGLWIDSNAGSRSNIERAWAREVTAGLLTFRQAFITVDTIDETIRTAGFSGEIDLLVVDIDGNDYHVLEKISAVSPRVICVEYNANFPAEVAWTMARDDNYVWDGIDYRIGVSLKALETLMSAKGYSLVGCSIAGVNAFFVRNELVEEKFAKPFTAENHYHPWRFFYAGSAHSNNWRGWRV